MDTTSLMVSLLFGSIGMGYLVYAKKQGRGVAFLSGASLCIIPYFSINIWLLILLGVIFIALPFFIRI